VHLWSQIPRRLQIGGSWFESGSRQKSETLSEKSCKAKKGCECLSSGRASMKPSSNPSRGTKRENPIDIANSPIFPLHSGTDCALKANTLGPIPLGQHHSAVQLWVHILHRDTQTHTNAPHISLHSYVWPPPYLKFLGGWQEIFLISILLQYTLEFELEVWLKQ
jgi:hypothetical protein